MHAKKKFKMGVFQKIQDNFMLVLIMVGGSLFLFIMSAYFENNGGGFGDNVEVAGSFDGEDISLQEFDSYYSKVLYLNGQNNTSNMDDGQKQQVKDRAWNFMIFDKAISREAGENGIGITENELEEMMVGEKPYDFYVNNLFGGQQNYEQIKAELSLDSYTEFAAINATDEADRDAKAEIIKKNGIDRRMQEKMFSLYNAAFFTTSSEALNTYQSKYSTKSIDFATVPYFAVSDSVVNVSDKDIKAFYEVNKGKYKYAKPTQKVVYASLRVDPTQEDDMEAKKWADETVKLFKEEKNNELFIKTEGELPVDYKYYKKGDGLSAELDNNLFGKEVGFVYGPYQSYKEGNKTYNVAKILDAQRMADSAKVSHILFTPEKIFEKLFQENPEPSEDEFKAAWRSFDEEAEKLVKELQEGADFTEYAAKYSKDTATAGSGGDLGWIQENSQMYSREFLDSIFIGDFKQTSVKKVEVIIQGGRSKYYQFVKVDKMGEKQEKLRVGIVDKSVLPGRTTRNNMFNKINQVAIELKNGAEMKSLVDSFGIRIDSVEVVPAQYVVNDLKGGRKLVRWAFKEDAKPTRVFEFDRKYIAAIKTGEPKTGYKGLDNEVIKGEIENKVRKLKKAEYIAEQLGDIKDLAEVKSKFSGASITSDSAVVVANGAKDLSFENKLSGAIAALKQGEVSKVIAGADGAYVVKVKTSQNAPITEDTNFDLEKQMLTQAHSGVVNYIFQELIDEKAKVEDNRQAVQ